MKGLQTCIDFLHTLLTGKRSPPPPRTEEESLYTVAGESRIARQYEQAARAAFRRGRYEDAIELATHSLRLDPDNWMAYYYLGSAYLEKGCFDEAIAVFERAREQGDPLGLVEGWMQEAQQRIVSTLGDSKTPEEETESAACDEEGEAPDLWGSELGLQGEEGEPNLL